MKKKIIFEKSNIRAIRDYTPLQCGLYYRCNILLLHLIEKINIFKKPQTIYYSKIAAITAELIQ